MDPVFFPFTYVTEPVARNLRACFDRSTVLMPSGLQVPRSMSNLADKGWLSIVTPFKADDAALETTIKNYREWADLHGPRHLRQFVEQIPCPPFHDDSSVYRLFEEIKTRSRDAGAMKNQSDRRSEFIFQSRIFILIAQEFDRRNRALRQDLAVVESMEHDFHRHLHATENAVAVNQLPDGLYHDDRERPYMLFERLTAWTCFLFQKAIPARIFVTTSQPVVDRLINSIPGVERVLAEKKIPVRGSGNVPAVNWRKDLGRWLADYTALNETGETKVPPQPPEARKGEVTLSLMVYRADQAPLKWFGRAAGVESLLEEAHDDRQNGKATVLAYIESEKNDLTI